MEIRDIRALTGLSQRKFAERYEIPRRTIEDWERKISEPPPYVLKMLERIVREDTEHSRIMHKKKANTAS